MSEAPGCHLPPVAILIPAYNCQDDLERSLEAIDWNSRLFDVIIVDDGSTPSISIPANLSELRITLLRLRTNKGLPAALNRGLEFIHEGGYEFIARLDAGDIPRVDRFIKQYEYMMGHPNCVLLGSYVDYVSEGGDLLLELRPPCDPTRLKTAIYSEECFVHPAVMMRTSCLRSVGFYNETFRQCEDFELFLRISSRFETAVLDEVLLSYVVAGQSFSARNRFPMGWSRMRALWLHRRPASITWYSGMVKALLTTAIGRPGALRLKRARQQLRSFLVD